MTQLTNNQVSDWDPDFSLDGSRITFKSNRDDSYGDIWIMAADGSSQRNLTKQRNTVEDWDPCL